MRNFHHHAERADSRSTKALILLGIKREMVGEGIRTTGLLIPNRGTALLPRFCTAYGQNTGAQ
jgi:hypothetical protein